MNITITHKEEIPKVTLFFEYLILGLLFLFLIPAGVFFVTYDSLPGESLYPYKIQLEDASLVLFSETPLNFYMHQLVLERRFDESMELYRRGKTDAFNLFIGKAESLVAFIMKEPDKDERVRLSSELITKLKWSMETLDKTFKSSKDVSKLAPLSAEVGKIIEILSTESIK